jgi:RND family efflux transporter MFP subunit
VGLVILLVVVAVVAFVGRGFLSSLVGSALAPEVTVARVTVTGGSAALSSNLTANGYAVAQRQAALAPKTTGLLEELFVVEGSQVKKGDVLARLEHRDIDAQLTGARATVELARVGVDQALLAQKRAEAELEESRRNVGLEEAGVAEAEAQLTDAERELRRQDDLLRQDTGLVADRDRALTQLDVSRARLGQAEARLASVRTRVDAFAAAALLAGRGVDAARATLDVRMADVALLEAQLEYVTLRAPFDGVVIRKNAEIGEIVSPISGGDQARVAVVTVVDMSSIMVEADVNEAYVGRVRRGQAVRITLDAFSDRVYPGKVFQIVPTADRQKATVEVKVSFDERDEGVVPEMAARVFFLEGEAEPGEDSTVIVVPEKARWNEGGITHVWAVTEGRVRKRLLSTLTRGEVVVVEGADDLEDGMKVKVKEKEDG